MKSPVDEETYRKLHPVTNSIDRDVRITEEVGNEVRETPGWEKSKCRSTRAP